MRSMVLVAVVTLLAAAMPVNAADASFADFDRRARAGERLNVVFFGASLTWGANATDPQRTSFRALVARRLEAAYPEAHFTFHDAAIGGTGSQLGVFRLDRDVLSRKPDLVFVDFSANDDIHSDNPETLASYEAIIRRIIIEARAPVVQVIFPFMWNVAAGSTDGMKRRDAHLAISTAYGTACGDAIALAIERVGAKQTTIERLWPVDGVHPGDEGYALFADAAWEAFQKAVAAKRVCAAPQKMLHADTYMRSARVRISSLSPLPAGWRVSRPHVVSAYYDMLMSRWLDDLTVAGGTKSPPAEKLKVRVSASMIMLFGEQTTRSGRFRVYVDGRLVEHQHPRTKKMEKEFDAGWLAKMCGGNVHLTQVIVEGLDPSVEHTLEIEPVLEADQELRIESICVAGGSAMVRRAER